MSGSTNVNELLETSAQILIRCFLMGFAVLWFWFLSMIFAADLVYQIQTAWFNISLEQFHLVSYTGMLAVKMVSFFFFLFPYIAIRLVLKKQDRSSTHK